jgi:prepilin-type N-terminal cleavage/methylation domain-containing protein
MGRRAFTLIEMLVVIVIMAIIASISLPALRGMGRGNAINAAGRQMLDDLSLARLKAISSRSTVYVVFVPTNVVARIGAETNPRVRSLLTNLVYGQYSSYAIVTRKTVGDQPGRERPRYVTEWKQLPDGVLFAPYKFDATLSNHDDAYSRAFQVVDNATFPFPTATNYVSNLGNFRLPVVAFNAAGQLISGRDEVIPLAEGSVFFTGTSGAFINPDVAIQPPGNWTNNVIRINWLTGRGSIERVAPL